MNPIKLSVKSTQKMMGEEPQTIEFMTMGKLYFKRGAHYIIYEESELSGLQGHKTSLRVHDETIVMNRYGPMPMHMHFEEGVRQTTLYETPYGSLKLEFLPHLVQSYIDEHSGKISIEYDMAIQGLKEASHKLDIDYTHIS